jgi:alpha-tubulin suppressor-like RCC1 family protein
VSGLDHVEKVVAGAFHTCALRDDHTVWCWGENADGQLGDPSFTSSARWTPAVVPNLSEVTSLALGFGSTCVTSSGAVLCWGNNLHEVVAPSGSSVRSPRRREGLGYAIEVVSRWGANCVCAVMELEGFLRCWGYNGEGAFGDGTTRSSWAPVQAMGRRPRSVALGDYTTCTAEMNGDVYCFGSNGGHALGTGEDARRRSTPQRLTGLSGAVQVSAGRNSTCAVLSTGEVYCWGEWEGGMVRPDRQRSGTPTPSKLEGLADVVQMTGAYEDGCAVSRDHSLRCWGVNVSGTVGDGTTDFRPEVTLVLAP